MTGVGEAEECRVSGVEIMTQAQIDSYSSSDRKVSGCRVMSSAECRVSNTSIEYRGSRVEGKRTATSTLSSFFALCALHLHSTLFPRPFPPLVTRHSFFHRSNRTRQNSDNLVQQ